jgi:hypothetical protein
MLCFFVLGGTFRLFFHGEDINMVKGHNVGFVVNLKSLTIHHKLIAFISIMVTALLESTECTT